MADVHDPDTTLTISLPRPTGLNSESDLEGGGSADGSAQLHHLRGQADADRLARQAAVMAEATSAFLARAGLRRGWACLDVGCGDGQATVQLARAVGPGGRAVGLDLDPTPWPSPARRPSGPGSPRALSARTPPRR